MGPGLREGREGRIRKECKVSIGLLVAEMLKYVGWHLVLSFRRKSISAPAKLQTQRSIVCKSHLFPVNATYICQLLPVLQKCVCKAKLCLGHGQAHCLVGQTCFAIEVSFGSFRVLGKPSARAPKGRHLLDCKCVHFRIWRRAMMLSRCGPKAHVDQGFLVERMNDHEERAHGSVYGLI